MPEATSRTMANSSANAQESNYRPLLVAKRGQQPRVIRSRHTELEITAWIAAHNPLTRRDIWTRSAFRYRPLPPSSAPLTMPPLLIWVTPRGAFDEQFRDAGSQDPQPAGIHRGAG